MVFTRGRSTRGAVCSTIGIVITKRLGGLRRRSVVLLNVGTDCLVPNTEVRHVAVCVAGGYRRFCVDVSCFLHKVGGKDKWGLSKT